MVDCSKCKNADRCEMWDFDKVRRTGECEVYEPITKADKIRSMSDEELAELFTRWSCEDADYATILDIKERKWGTKEEIVERNLKYLQSEAE